MIRTEILKITQHFQLVRVVLPQESTHAVVELLEPGDGEELVHVDAVVEEEADEVDAVALQGLLRRLLQRARRPLLTCDRR